MKEPYNKFEGRDQTRDREGVKASRRKARRAKKARRAFENNGHTSKHA